MMKKTLFAIASLAMLSAPLASHAQMQVMDQPNLRDVAGQGLIFHPLTSWSAGSSFKVLGKPLFDVSAAGGILAPKSFSLWTPNTDITIHLQKLLRF